MLRSAQGSSGPAVEGAGARVEPARQWAATIANAGELIADTRMRFMPDLLARYPGLTFEFEGQAQETAVTGASLQRNFLLGLAAVFLLLCFQFRSYFEPIVVMAAIPVGLVGVIWGHLALGLDLSMPSMVGFASLEATSTSEAPGLDLSPVNPCNRRSAETSLVNVDSGVDSEDVLMPSWLRRRRVPGHNAAHALDGPQVLIPGLSDLALEVAVIDAAPECPDTGEVADLAIVADRVLEILPPFEHGTRVDEPDRAEPGLDRGADWQSAQHIHPGPAAVARAFWLPPSPAIHHPQ